MNCEHHFPLEPDVAVAVASYSPIGRNVAGKTASDVVELIRNEWAFPGMPHLQRLADSICGKTLTCLTQFEDDYFFTFRDPTGFPLSLPLRSAKPAAFVDRVSAEGFREFVCRFGDLVDGSIPPGSFVMTPESSLVVEPGMPAGATGFRWGEVGPWAGAHTFFHSCCGDYLVIKDSGAIGRWLHEMAWGNDSEVCVKPVAMSFPQLIEAFAIELATPFNDRDSRSAWA